MKGLPFSSTSSPLETQQKGKNKPLSQAVIKKTERDWGGEERTLFPDSKRKEKGKARYFLPASKKALKV